MKARLEFELIYYDVTVKHVNHYATGIQTHLSIVDVIFVITSFGLDLFV